MIGNDLYTYIGEKMPGLKLLKNQCLADYTSFKIGGKAVMAFPKTGEELTELYCLCLQAGHRPLILGAGTNVLAPDGGVSRLVICTRDMNGAEVRPDGTICAQSGMTLTKLACIARDNGLTGLEFAHGIPGTVGGGVYMNAGAYGGELKQVVIRTRALLPDGTVRDYTGEQQRFDYRHSAFMELDAVILEAEFSLEPGNREEISVRMKELAEKRRCSQPLEYPSAGSTFKRPVGGYAAALIDQAGLKGLSVGDAQVSEKHAGFVINVGRATAEDVKKLMQEVENRVFSGSGIRLEPEVRIWQEN